MNLKTFCPEEFPHIIYMALPLTSWSAQMPPFQWAPTPTWPARGKLYPLPHPPPPPIFLASPSPVLLSTWHLSLLNTLSTRVLICIWTLLLAIKMEVPREEIALLLWFLEHYHPKQCLAQTGRLIRIYQTKQMHTCEKSGGHRDCLHQNQISHKPFYLASWRIWLENCRDLGLWFSPGSDFFPSEPLSMGADIFDCHNSNGWAGATGTQWVVPRGAPKCPPVYRLVPTTKNDAPENSNSAKAEKP